MPKSHSLTSRLQSLFAAVGALLLSACAVSPASAEELGRIGAPSSHHDAGPRPDGNEAEAVSDASPSAAQKRPPNDWILAEKEYAIHLELDEISKLLAEYIKKKGNGFDAWNFLEHLKQAERKDALEGAETWPWIATVRRVKCWDILDETAHAFSCKKTGDVYDDIDFNSEDRKVGKEICSQACIDRHYETYNKFTFPVLKEILLHAGYEDKISYPKSVHQTAVSIFSSNSDMPLIMVSYGFSEPSANENGVIANPTEIQYAKLKEVPSTVFGISIYNPLVVRE